MLTTDYCAGRSANASRIFFIPRVHSDSGYGLKWTTCSTEEHWMSYFGDNSSNKFPFPWILTRSIFPGIFSLTMDTLPFSRKIMSPILAAMIWGRICLICSCIFGLETMGLITHIWIADAKPKRATSERMNHIVADTYQGSFFTDLSSLHLPADSGEEYRSLKKKKIFVNEITKNYGKFLGSAMFV